MIRSTRFLVSLAFALLFLGTDAFAQWNIEEEEQLYRIRVWRRVDLREKQNKGFYSQGREFTKFITDAINSGALTTIYSDDLLTDEIGVDGFNKNRLKTGALQSSVWDALAVYAFNEIVEYNGKFFSSNQDPNSGIPPDDPVNGAIYWSEMPADQMQAQYFEGYEFGIIEIIEDIIFDKRRSRLYFDIEAIKLVIPEDIGLQANLAGETPMGIIMYDELEPVLRADPNAKWINRYNPKEWKNFADALLLRTFSGTIKKYENPDNMSIAEMFAGQHWDAVEEIYRYEMFLMEKEHNLWEY